MCDGLGERCVLSTVDVALDLNRQRMTPEVEFCLGTGSRMRGRFILTPNRNSPID